MGAITRINANAFKEFDFAKFSGVALVYKSVNAKTGERKFSAVTFEGAEYTPADIKQDEVFRVWKNVVTAHWLVKAKERELREDNGGITAKLRNGVPCEIIVSPKEGHAKRWDVEGSVWQRIGLVPTKKDLEVAARDFKKKIHAATKASFEALSFRINFAAAEAPAKEAKPKKESAKDAKIA